MAQPPQRVRNVAMFLAAIWAVTCAHAQLVPNFSDDVKAYDPRDLALLPPFCKYTQDFRERVPGGGERDKAERWEAAAGPVFQHLHHYCWGLMKANRGLLLATTELARKHYLNDAVLEFNYVIERSPRGHVLLPEILARKGQALLRLGQIVLGLESLERSVDAKPDYWPPYAHASDFFGGNGETGRAREWLERGLKHSPGSSELKSRLADLEREPPRRNGKAR